MVGVVVLSASVAAAQATPDDHTDTTSSEADADAGTGMDAGSGAGEPDEEPLTQAEEEKLASILGNDTLAHDCDGTTGPSGGNATSIVPDSCWGRFPSSHYDIGCDEGAWNHLGRKAYCAFTDMAFQAARAATAFALWIVGWAYGFGVHEHLAEPMINIAQTYESDLIGPLGLRHVAWTYAICWAAIISLRGKLTTAAGELATSIVLAGLAGILLANPSGYLDGAFRTTSLVSGTALATGSGHPPPENADDAAKVVAPLQEQLHHTFVAEPYDHLNWGDALTGTCAATRDRILAVGPHGNSDTPRKAMQATGCDDQADFNHDPSGQRLLGAVLTVTAAIVMVVLLTLIAITIIVAQIVAVVLFALAPFAALGAVLTGGGRDLAWRWLATLIRVALVVIGMSFVLALVLLTTNAILTAAQGHGLIERFVLVNLVVVAAFIARKRVVTAGSQLASQLGSRLSQRAGGGQGQHSWGAAGAGAAAGGISGFAIGSSLGMDPRGRTSRAASFVARDRMAERRLSKQRKIGERRSRQPVARERTELTVDGQGNPITRRSVSIDGPAPTTRRGRTARQNLEATSRSNALAGPSANLDWTRTARQPTTPGSGNSRASSSGRTSTKPGTRTASGQTGQKTGRSSAPASRARTAIKGARAATQKLPRPWAKPPDTQAGSRNRGGSDGGGRRGLPKPSRTQPPPGHPSRRSGPSGPRRTSGRGRERPEDPWPSAPPDPGGAQQGPIDPEEA